MPAPDEREIGKVTRALLRRADVQGAFPTPVDHIVATAGLELPPESLLSRSVLDEAPAHIRRAISRLSGRVRAILDRKTREVHVDPSVQNEGRVAFLKLHEVGHDILPWQRELGYADDDATLAPTVRRLFELEASVSASNLLFQHEYFQDLARQYRIGMAAVLDVARVVGASGHATFRRYVCVHDGVVAGVVMDLSPCSSEPLAYRRHEMVTSEAWKRTFGGRYWPPVLRTPPFTFVARAERARTSSGVVRTDLLLPNLRNEPVRLEAEIYSNQHNLFVLIWKPRREALRRRTILVPSAASVSL